MIKIQQNGYICAVELEKFLQLPITNHKIHQPYFSLLAGSLADIQINLIKHEVHKFWKNKILHLPLSRKIVPGQMTCALEREFITIEWVSPMMIGA